MMIDVLECKGIHKHFGGLHALNDVNLKVKKGEILGVIGPNGAGKTTLFNIISGAIRPTSGEVFFRSRGLSGFDAAQVCRSGIARTYQLVRPFHSLTALENVLVGITYGRFHPPPRDERIDEAMGILEFMGLGSKGNKTAESLTLAEKKHLEIARALGTAPEVLLLDEVVSGLTPTETLRTIDTIRQIQGRNVTIIMIEHVLKVVMELCQRVFVLNYGVEIAEGSPQEVVRNPDVVAAYLGKLEMNENPGGERPHA
jgi:branched-chain amino acid transport system ATP-binding protein